MKQEIKNTNDVDDVFRISNTKRRVKYVDGTEAIIKFSPLVVRLKDHPSPWSDLLPSDIAQSQMAWEKRHTICRMRNLGFTIDEISNYWSILPREINSIIKNHRRKINEPAPATRWMNEDVVKPILSLVNDLELQEKLFEKRQAKQEAKDLKDSIRTAKQLVADAIRTAKQLVADAAHVPVSAVSIQINL